MRTRCCARIATFSSGSSRSCSPRASRSCSTPTNTQPPNHPTTQSLLLLLCLLCGHSNFRCRHRLLFVKNDLSSIFGVPCRSAEDVNWLNESLHPELSDAEARKFFQCDHRPLPPHSPTGSQTLGSSTCRRVHSVSLSWMLVVVVAGRRSSAAWRTSGTA